MTQREQLIAEWIRNNPNADEWQLSDVWFTGIVVARAYLSKYQ